MYRRNQPWLGTYVEISIRDEIDANSAHAAIDAAFAAIAQVHRLMSFHELASDLSRINAMAFEEDIRVHPWTYQVLIAAKDLFVCTDGIFDCTIAPYLQRHGLLPGTSQVDLSATMNDVCLNPPNSVRYKKRLCLDLGGIAKGFAVDCAIDVLRQLGVISAVVNAGGDMRVLGELPEQIYIRDPHAPNRMMHAGELSNGAIATSGIYFSKNLSVNPNQSALVDPLQCKSVLASNSFSVLAPTCMLADGLTKALAINRHPGATYLKKYAAQAVIV